MARLSQVFAGKDREFFDLFEKAADNIVHAADLLDQMLAHHPDRVELTRDIVICEHEGDRITHDVHQKLNSTFVTPIDREDGCDWHVLALHPCSAQASPEHGRRYRIDHRIEWCDQVRQQKYDQYGDCNDPQWPRENTGEACSFAGLLHG